MKLIMSFLLMIGFTVPCLGKVDLESTQPLVIPEDTVTPKLTKNDVAKVIPTDLKQGDSQTTIMKRIADRGVSLWFNSDVMKETSIGRFAETAQEKLKTDVILPTRTPQGVNHKLSFKVEAFQALAKLEYTGYLNASVNYDAKASATDILFKEKIFTNKNLLLSHKVHKDQDLSMIGLAWSW
ncbi:MAG: hypothetical protein ACXVCY_05375 [Pseudobdellovibrionaceae bacterium]